MARYLEVTEGECEICKEIKSIFTMKFEDWKDKHNICPNCFKTSIERILLVEKE